MKNEVRVRAIGDLDAPARRRCAASSSDVIELTRDEHRLTVGLCVSYGGREDIVEATRRLAREVQAGALDPDGDRSDGASPTQLGTAGIPDPDLLIRTSGEMRISNFFLWQLAYTRALRHRDAVAGFPRAGLRRRAGALSSSASGASA